MNKGVFTHIIIMVVAIFLGSNLAIFLHNKQTDAVPAIGSITKIPIGGFHKFASDIEWMRFINYMGGLKTINDENKEEVSKRLSKILELDPSFSKAYHMGALSLSNADPLKAVAFLKQACDSKDNELKSNWQIPFLAGFILMHYASPPNYSEAALYFEEALKRSGGRAEDYVVNCYLRAKGKATKNIANSKLAMLDSLYVEWKKSNSEMMESSIIPNLNERLLKAAREAKNSSPNDAEIQRMVTEISAKILTDKHLCPGCLANIGPGDKFCAACGLKTVVYGTCSKCQSVLKGRFCVSCGNDSGK